MTIGLIELARNIYGASGGTVGYPSVYSTLYTLMWNEAFRDAYDAVDRMPKPAGDYTGADYDAADAVFNATLAQSLGWSDAEFQDFWTHTRTTRDEAMAHEDAWDTFDKFVESLRRGGR